MFCIGATLRDAT